MNFKNIENIDRKVIYNEVNKIAIDSSILKKGEELLGDPRYDDASYIYLLIQKYLNKIPIKHKDVSIGETGNKDLQRPNDVGDFVWDMLYFGRRHSDKIYFKYRVTLEGVCSVYNGKGEIINSAELYKSYIDIAKVDELYFENMPFFRVSLEVQPKVINNQVATKKDKTVNGISTEEKPAYITQSIENSLADCIAYIQQQTIEEFNNNYSELATELGTVSGIEI